MFVTISKFGALNCALIGLGRKMLSLLLSFVLYGHTLNAFQTVGLTLSLTAMIANFYEKSGGPKHGHGKQVESSDQKEAEHAEKTMLLAPDDSDTEDGLCPESHGEKNRQQDAGVGVLELLDLRSPPKVIQAFPEHDFTTLPEALPDTSV